MLLCLVDVVVVVFFFIILKSVSLQILPVKKILMHWVQSIFKKNLF